MFNVHTDEPGSLPLIVLATERLLRPNRAFDTLRLERIVEVASEYSERPKDSVAQQLQLLHCVPYEEMPYTVRTILAELLSKTFERAGVGIRVTVDGPERDSEAA